MGKNAGHTVQALLARAPAPPRAHTPASSSLPAAQPDQAEQEHHAPQAQALSAQAAPAPATPLIAAPSRRQRRSPAPTKPSPPTEPTAPPTLRLSQPIAEALRAAWLAAKRDRVLLTYQDFAGEIIAAGLRGEGRRPATEDKFSSVAGSPVPRTLRLSQPTAQALRAAWLAAKRDRVLLTYQDFAGEVIAAGLQQRLQ
ncbi:MAG: hypothetical protein LC721_07075 [Actinobacteria bacterium]|nr:hypothetical protein [Actinomycetota bacterium]